jgi:hypothetical protein
MSPAIRSAMMATQNIFVFVVGIYIVNLFEVSGGCWKVRNEGVVLALVISIRVASEPFRTLYGTVLDHRAGKRINEFRNTRDPSYLRAGFWESTSRPKRARSRACIL